MPLAPFLVNPVQIKKRKRKSSVTGVIKKRKKRICRDKPGGTPKGGHKVGRPGKRHRPVAYTVGKKWRTSPKAKIARKSYFINPGLAIVGGMNPMAKRRGRKRKAGRRRHRRNPVGLAANPRRRKRYRRNMPMATNRKRRGRRRYRRNPAMGGALKGLSVGRVQAMLPLAVTGVASGVITNMVPGMVGLQNPWAITGSKAVIALVGGPMIGNFMKGNHGMVWTVVGLATVVQDLVRQFMPGVIPGLSQYPDYYDQYGYAGEGVSAYPEEVSAYPEEVSGYDEMGQYPYDGTHEYGYSY